MINNVSNKITKYLIKKNIIELTEKNIYNYCIENTIVVLITYSVLLIFSCIFNEFKSMLAFTFLFTLFRKICGGFHAKNYTICGTISLFSYLFFVFTIKKMTFLFEYNFTIMLISLIIILMLSPIPHNNKPFTVKQQVLFKIISKSLAILFIVITIIIKLSGRNDLINSKIYFSSCYGILLAAISLLISKFERRYKNEKI